MTELDGQLKAILLEPEQQDLLCRLVEAFRRVPPDQRVEFLVLRSTNGDHIIHPALDEGLRGAFSDLEILAAVDLVRFSYSTGGSSPGLFVTPLGFRYYDFLKRRAGEPVRQVEAEIRSYLCTDEFRRRHRAAFEKWAAAEELLWSSDSERALSTIGHLCREGMQEFADSLVRQFTLESRFPDKSKVIDRIRGVLGQRGAAVSSSEEACLDALLVYWGTVNDLVQRQEHASQREARCLTWQDGRRVVFQVLVVMFEISGAVRR